MCGFLCKVRLKGIIILLACNTLTMQGYYLQPTQNEQKIVIPDLNKSFFERASEGEEVCASWMKDLAYHCIYGTQEDQFFDKHHYTLLANAETVYQLTKALEKLNLAYSKEHILLQMGSLPLSDTQINSFYNYTQALLNKPSDQFDSAEAYNQYIEPFFEQCVSAMTDWSYNTLLESYQTYSRDNQEHGMFTTPFVHWISEIFDLRIMNLPEVDMYKTINTLAIDNLKQFLQQFFVDFEYTQNEFEILQQHLVDFIYAQHKEDKRLEQDHKEEFAKNLTDFLPYQAFDNHIAHFLNSFADSDATILIPKTREMYDFLDQFTEKCILADRLNRKLHSAQKILKPWNARNFQLLGSSDHTMYAHEAYGKMMASSDIPERQQYAIYDAEGKLIPEMQQWHDTFYGEHTFPIHKFTSSNKQELQTYDFKNIFRADDMLTTFFNYTHEQFGSPDVQEAQKRLDPFKCLLTLPNPDTKILQEEEIVGSASQIMENISYNLELLYDPSNENRPSIHSELAQYQCFYQLILAMAITDNKFAFELLSNPYPFFVSLSIIAGDQQYNPLGMILCYVRSTLLYLMQEEPEYVDFVTQYYSEHINGVFYGSGHCRMDLRFRTDYNDDFSTVFSHRTDTQTDLENNISATTADHHTHWIKPFRFKNSLDFISNNLWSIKLEDIIHGNLETPYGITYINKYMQDRSFLQVYKPEHRMSQYYFPAITKDLTQYTINKIFTDKANGFHHQEVCNPTMIIQGIEKQFLYWKYDRDQIQSILDTLKDFVKTNNQPEQLFDYAIQQLEQFKQENNRF